MSKPKKEDLVAAYEKEIGFGFGSGCKICAWDLQEAVREILSKGGTVAGISRFLTSEGWPVTESAVRRHRNNHP